MDFLTHLEDRRLLFRMAALSLIAFLFTWSSALAMTVYVNSRARGYLRRYRGHGGAEISPGRGAGRTGSQRTGHTLRQSGP